MKIKLDSFPPCSCGKPGYWHGPRNGHREFMCDEYWNAGAWFVQSIHLRHEPRFYFITNNQGADSPFDMTTSKAKAERQCKLLNDERNGD